MVKSFIFAVSVFLASSVSPLLAQTAVPFTLAVQQGTHVTPVANGQTLGITSTGVGQPTTFTLTGTYTGTTTAVFSAGPQLVGSPDFSAGTITPAIPLTLAPGASFSLNITYQPSSTAVASAQLSLPFSITPAPNSTAPPTQGVLAFNLSGTTANMTVNYFSAPSNNITPVSNGGTVSFPSTLVTTTSTVTFVVVNSGSAAGNVNAITLTGTNNAFQLQGVGLLPAGLQSGGSLTFNVLYTPTVVGNDTGTLTIQFPTGPFVVNLTGSSVSPTLTYQIINGTTTSQLTAGQLITLPDTDVGSSSTETIQITNNGTAPATITTIAVAGGAFSLTNLPILPVVVAANSSISFTLTFAPTTPAVASGILTVGNVRFPLSATGLGAQLTFSYVAAGSTNVQGGTTVLFPSVPLAQTTTVNVTVTNSGTIPSSITSIGIVAGQATSAFTIPNPPALPVTLKPKDSLTFPVVFSPVAVGLNTATLLVNTTALTLSGFGTSAPALPSFQITGASGQVQPFTQPAVGLTLSQGYPLDVTGTLTLAVNSSVFAADPAVQFATGGRTINFTIPANTTKAVFSTGGTTISFQTGTVAENITLSATFATGNGVNITPTNVSSLVLTVPALAPTLLSVQITAISPTNITLLVEGYSTTRSLSKLNFQFSSLSSTFALSTTSFSLDVSQSSGFWYSSNTSQTFGGEFAITYPFTLQVPANNTLTLPNNVAVSVTATNSVGTSNSVSSQ